MDNFIFAHVKSEIIIIIVIVFNFPIGLHSMALCYNRRQDDTMRYTTIEYNKITHITENNPKLKATISTKLKKNQNLYNTLHNSDTIRTYSRWMNITNHWVYKTVTKPYYKILKYTNFTKIYTSIHITNLIYNTQTHRLQSFLFKVFSWSSPYFNCHQ